MIDGINARTLVIAAHPDDEALGAGGWMARYPGTCAILTLSEGTTAYGLTTAEAVTRFERKREILLDNAERFGHSVLKIGTRPVLQLHKADIEMAREIDDWVRLYQPTVILTHSPSDLNQDHRVIAEATMVAARPYGAGSSVKAVLGFTVDPFSAPAFTPRGADFCVSLSEEQLQAKVEMCAAYDMEMRPAPHPRSPEGIRRAAQWWGAKIHRNAAEPYTFLWGCQ